MLQRLKNRLAGGQDERIAKLEATLSGTRKALKAVQTNNSALMTLIGKLYAERWDENESATPQERAWSGEHGVQYVLGHLNENWRGTRVPYWKVILGLLPEVQSVCEFGCNIGANLKAIKKVRPDADVTGIEINMVACEILRSDKIGHVHHGSIADKDLGKTFDLVFSRGVLIHLNPDDLQKTFANMVRHSHRYVMIYEIYSPEAYHLSDYSSIVRGGENGEGYQFWRDFSADFQKAYPTWKAVRSGVSDKPDVKPSKGDIHWTIFERP